MTLLFFHLIAVLGGAVYASSSSVSVSSPFVSLPSISMPCSDLEALNANLGPLLNLAQFIPPSTPSSFLPQLEPRLAAIESFTAGYRDLVNAFGATNCGATLDTTGLNTRLRTRQSEPDPLEIVCEVLELVLLLVSEAAAEVIQALEDVLGCQDVGRGATTVEA
ncbi:hypothetical protein BDW75DRAFT_244799 [Aspergillus navahoensis]